MKTERFEAILSKNDIARELREAWKTGDKVNTRYVLAQLEIIERYLGEANQPSVRDIFESETEI